MLNLRQAQVLWEHARASVSCCMVWNQSGWPFPCPSPCSVSGRHTASRGICAKPLDCLQRPMLPLVRESSRPMSNCGSPGQMWALLICEDSQSLCSPYTILRKSSQNSLPMQFSCLCTDVCQPQPAYWSKIAAQHNGQKYCRRRPARFEQSNLGCCRAG